MQRRQTGLASLGLGFQQAPQAPVSAQTKSLDLVRQKLSVLQGSIQELSQLVEMPLKSSKVKPGEINSGMASWPALLRTLTTTTSQLEELNALSFPSTGVLDVDNRADAPDYGLSAPTLPVTLNTNTALHVYPQSTFPGRTCETIIGFLLRKKWHPDVSTWADEATEAALSALSQPDGDHTEATADRPTLEELVALWEWAGPAGNEVAQTVLGVGGGGDGDDDDDGDYSDDDDMGLIADDSTMDVDGSTTVDDKPRGDVAVKLASIDISVQGSSGPIPLDDIMRFMHMGKTLP